MIVCEEIKLVFLEVPGTGSRSVRAWLEEEWGGISTHSYHGKLMRGYAWNYRHLAVVRNPVRRFESVYKRHSTSGCPWAGESISACVPVNKMRGLRHKDVFCGYPQAIQVAGASIVPFERLTEIPSHPAFPEKRGEIGWVGRNEDRDILWSEAGLDALWHWEVGCPLYSRVVPVKA